MKDFRTVRVEKGDLALILTVTSHFPEDFVLILDFEREQLPFTDQVCLPFELVVKSVEIFVDVDARNVDDFQVAVGLEPADVLRVIAADSVGLGGENTDHASAAKNTTNAIDKPVCLGDFTIAASQSLRSCKTKFNFLSR